MNTIKETLINLRASLWFVPGLMIVFSIALALVLIEVDSSVKLKWLVDYPRIFGLGADGSRGMLTAIASSMLTVAALAFSLTLAAVTQASGQFTPRIFRNFMRDRANQFILGYFVSIFAYCLIVLRTIRGADEVKFVPSLAVLCGLVLAIGGVLVLIFFIHHIADSLQITTILNNITDETKQAVRRMYPQEMGDEAVEGEQNATWLSKDVKSWRTIPAREAGYVQDVDIDGLLEFAAANRILIQMRRGVGQFAGRGATIAEIAPEVETPNREPEIGRKKSEQINGFFTIDRHRPIEKDVGFGIRQIVDIALKALSPGVNDTTTAINCIDNLGEIVAEIARRLMPAKLRSKDNVPRVITLAPDFQEYVETAFDQIRISGKANFAIFERLLTTVSFVAECTGDDSRRRVLCRQIELIGEFADQTLETDYEKERVRTRSAEAGLTFSK
ncbi:MAG: DUF2254 domain-containing protein [Pyrinomonadaceae bacterium]